MAQDKQAPASACLTRRSLLVAAAATVGTTALGLRSATAQSTKAAWPAKPIRVIVPYAAGQGADVLTRLVANELSKTLSQPVYIENRAGAGGNIGAAAAARSDGDGYTFMLGTNATNAANEFLYANRGFEPGDFVGVAMIGLLPMVICTSAPDLPTNGLAELIARARAKPDTLNVGLPSTTAQVVFAEFVRSAQAPLFGVMYKGSGQSLIDAIGGQIPLAIDTVTASRAYVATGKLRALAITSLKASDMLPGVKPVSEQGVPGFDVVAWDALFAPKSTPPDIVAKMGEHIRLALQAADARRRMLDIGVEPLAMGPAELDAFVKTERAKWGSIIKTAGIKVE